MLMHLYMTILNNYVYQYYTHLKIVFLPTSQYTENILAISVTALPCVLCVRCLLAGDGPFDRAPCGTSTATDSFTSSPTDVFLTTLFATLTT